MICEVEVFKYFNKVMGAMPEKKKAESKKKQQNKNNKNEGNTAQ